MDFNVSQDGPEVRCYGLLCEYRSAPKLSAGLMHLFEELHVVHCGQESRKGCQNGWPLLWAICLANDAQQEAEAQI